MGDLVNLRRARKARGKQQAADQAATNRALHGRTRAAKAEEKAEDARREKASRALDQARREPEG
jgi:hypothetical protein